jgi:hypothetical protein
VEYHEDPIPLHDVRIDLGLAGQFGRAYSAADGTDVSLRALGQGWRVEIPEVAVSAVIVLEPPTMQME